MADDERIDIEVRDKVSPNVSKKLLKIAQNARNAFKAVRTLKEQIASIDGSRLNRLANSMGRLGAEQRRLTRETTLSNVAQDKANLAYLKTESALSRATAAETRAKIATEQLRTATERTAIAKQRLKTTVQQTAAAESRATATALRLKNAQDRLASSTKRASSNFASFLRSAAAFAGLSLGGAAVLRGLDSYTLLENKLRNLVDTEEDLVKVTEEIFKIANDSRAPIQDVAQLFQRLDRALIHLGVSQRETLDLTETISKAAIVSGATATEQAGALLQLSQAFNKGKLDGQEFKSVMEQMPILADAIAKQMGVTRGELLKLAPQGRITAEIMRDAFANAREEILDKFGKLVPTLGQSFNVLKNSAIEFFGELNNGIGVTTGISKALLWLSENMDLFGIALTGVATTLVVIFTPSILTAATAVKGFTLAIASNPIGLFVVAVSTATAAVVIFRNEIKLTADGTVSLNDAFEALTGTAKDDLNPEIEKTSGLFSKLGIIAVNTARTLLKIVKFTADDFGLKKIGASASVALVALDALLARARQLAEARKAAAGGLRGEKDPIDAGTAIFEIIDKIKEQTRLATMLNDERAVEQRLMRATLQLRKQGIELTPAENELMREQISLLQEAEKQGALRNQIITSSFEYRMNLLEDEYDRIDELRARDLISDEQHVIAKIKTWNKMNNLRLAGASAFFGSLEGLQSSSSKRLARVGKAAAIASAVVNTYKGASSAFADTPGSIYVKLAAAAAATASGLANVQNIRNAGNFANGGIIPGTSTSGDNLQINANSREAVLTTGQQKEFMEIARGRRSVRTRSSVGTSSSAQAVEMNVTVENYGSSEITVERLSATDVRIIARDELDKNGAAVVAADLDNPNGRMANSMARNTNVEKRR